MANLFNGLSIALSSIRAQTNMLNVIGHNIANANTPGFSRQTVTLTPIAGLNGDKVLGVGELRIGGGVDVKQAARTRYALYDEIYRRENQSLTYYTKMENLVRQVEVLYDEPSDRGLGTLLNNFYNSWYDIANDPGSIAARQQLHNTADELTGRINRYYTSLVEIYEAIDNEIANIPDKINQLTTEVARLNTSIEVTEVNGISSNDLRDQRDAVIDQLTEYSNIQVAEKDSGAVAIFFGDRVVVDGAATEMLSAKSLSAEDRDFRRHSIISKDGTEYVPTQGELGALIDFRDNVLMGLLDDLDTLAETLVTTVNAEHRNGAGLDGVTGWNFFDPESTNAFSIKLSDDISNVANIAASADGSIGDNTNAVTIADLKDRKVIDNYYTITEFYNGIISKLGILSQEAAAGRKNLEMLVSQIENTRQSFQGVNIDEELVLMIQTQRLYQSASRLISVMDRMLETLIAM